MEATDVDARAALLADEARRLAEGRRVHDGPGAVAARRAARYAQAHRALPVAARRAAACFGCDSQARKRARAPRSPCSTATRSTSTSTRRSAATGCCAATSAASSRRAKTRSSISPARSTSARGGCTRPARLARTPRSSASCSGCSRAATDVPLHPPRSSTTTASTRRDARARLLAALGGRIVLHFLPPYCPDANRIERVWQDFHANVTRNHRCKTMNRLLDNARRYLDALPMASRPPATHRPSSRLNLFENRDRSFSWITQTRTSIARQARDRGPREGSGHSWRWPS